jgi:hypothetical protein
MSHPQWYAIHIFGSTFTKMHTLQSFSQTKTMFYYITLFACYILHVFFNFICPVLLLNFAMICCFVPVWSTSVCVMHCLFILVANLALLAKHLIISSQSPVFSLLSLKRKVRLMRSPVCLSVCLSLSVCVSVCLSVCPHLITFEPIGRFLWNSVGRSCHWRWPRRRTFESRIFNHSKMTRSNFWGGWKTCTTERGTMKFCTLIDLKRRNNF